MLAGVILIVLLIGGLILGSCVGGIFIEETTAVEALETQGYSNITITDKDWFMVGARGCSDDDIVKFDAVATNPIGKEVEVYVCRGLFFKGATVRSK